VIRFLQAEGHSAKDIHRRLCRVYGDNVIKFKSLNKRHGMLTKGVVLLHDNARPHTAARTKVLLQQFNWEIFEHPPYSQHLAPSDYHLFTKMKVCWLTNASKPTRSSWMESTTGWVPWQCRSVTRDYKSWCDGTTSA
jgi:transposase